MSQTILIEPDAQLQKIFNLNLNTYAATDVVLRDNAQDTIALLSILPSIDLIITSSQVQDEKTAVLIHQYLKENNLDIPMIVTGDCRELVGDVLVLKSPISWEVLVKHAAKTLGVEREEIQREAEQKYVPIATHYFYDIDHTPCDVFIRIKKGDHSYQFVKRLHAQDSFTPQDIQKYEKQGLQAFYVTKDFQQYFVTFVTNNLIQQLEKKELDLNKRIELNANAYEIVKDQINFVGIDESTAQLADSCIESMVTSIQQAPALATLLKKLFSNKISYAYQHAHLVCVIGDFILSKQKWYDKKHLETFAVASFFADITLKSPKQIQINTSAELAASDLDDGQRQAVINHAFDAAELIQDYPKSDHHIENLILHHHGSEDGSGFPKEPSEEINPLAKVFIVADAFVKMMLSPDAPKNKKDILAILYAQYTAASYQKIIKVLENKID